MNTGKMFELINKNANELAGNVVSEPKKMNILKTGKNNLPVYHLNYIYCKLKYRIIKL